MITYVSAVHIMITHTFIRMTSMIAPQILLMILMVGECGAKKKYLGRCKDGLFENDPCKVRQKEGFCEFPLRSGLPCTTCNLKCKKDANECTLGTANCDVNAACTNTKGSFTCSCNSGYIGDGQTCTVQDCGAVLPKLDLRGSSYTADVANEDKYLTMKWYSTYGKDGQYQMVDITKIPEFNKCGTMFPIYMADTHPPFNDIGTSEIVGYACTKTFAGNCNPKFTIKIRKCDGKLEYYLPRTESASAYCFDLAIAQAADEAPGDEALPTDVQVIPKLIYHQEVDIDNDDFNRPELVFKCSFTEAAPDYFYYSDWIVNNNNILSKGPSMNKDDLDLFETEILNNGYGLGIMIKCHIRVAKSETGLLTDTVSSDGFFAGIKVHTRRISMKRNEKSTIVFEPTVPLGCAYKEKFAFMSTAFCFNEIQMINANKTNEYSCKESILTVNSPDWCGIKMMGLIRTEADAWVAKNYSMDIETTTASYNEEILFTVILSTGDYGSHPIWHDYLIDYVTVEVVDDIPWAYKKCYSHIDPHMYTADGWPYEHQNREGEFILYRNKKYAIEIQEQIITCHSSPKCTCAVSVRAGGDIFMINICGATKVITFPSCKENILDVRELNGGNTYQVYTPIGTYVEIAIIQWRTYGQYLNLDVYLSPKDFGNTEGLCGNFDGDRSNDLTHSDGTVTSLQKYPYAFTDSWQIQTDESYLNPDNWNPSLYGNEFTFCVCKASLNDEFVPADATAVCSKTESQLCDKNDKFPSDSIAKECTVRAKRSTSSYQKELRRRLHSSKVAPYTLYKRSENTVSLEVATKECNDSIMNSFVATSGDDRLSMADVAESIGNCIYDYTSSGDNIYITVHTDINNRIVKNFNYNDPKYTTQHSEEVAAFEQQSCRGNCNGNGVCNKGVCACKEKYRGADCSIDITEGLNIEDIEADGLCDLAEEEDCRCFSFQTLNLLPGFVCNVMTIKTRVNAVTSGVDATTTGERDDLFNGKCCIADNPLSQQSANTGNEQIFITEYKITISNDGANFGYGRSVYVFDSTCQDNSMDSNGNVTFRLKSGFCFIDGVCVAENTKSLDTNNEDYHCSPKTDAYSWTASTPENGPCIESCTRDMHGNYQSCKACDVYATCIFGSLFIDYIPCNASLVWDDNIKECANTSITCQ